MPRVIGKLSARTVATAKPKAGRRALVLADGGNLYLQVTRGKDGGINRSWTFRYQIDGKRGDMGLGPTYTLGIAQARAKAKALREQLLDDVDPLEAKEAARRAKLAEAAKTVTFERCAEMYINLHQAGWGARHLHQWRSSLAAYVYPKIGKLSVADVDQAVIMQIIEPLWAEKVVTAARVRGRIEAILDYAIAHRFREGGDNPARITSALPKKARIAKVEHLAALPWADIPQFMAELRDVKGVVARALEFTILCAARSGETLGATWDEVEGDIWTIPASRMKGGREHRIPLPARARAILESLPKDGRYIFQRAGGQPLAAVAMRQGVLQRLRPNATVHGTARASFKTWAGERTSFPRETVEIALAHRIGNQTEQSYERGDKFEKRRRLMSAWADYLGKPAAAGKTVIPLRRSGAME